MYQPLPSSQAGFRSSRDVESQLRDLTQDFATAFNTANYDQAAEFFAADGVFMAPLYEGAYGQRSVEQLLQRMGEGGYHNLRLGTTRVDHSEGMAMEIGHFSVVVRKSDGSLTQQRGKYVKVWRRLGAWLVVADCWSRTSQAQNQFAA